MPGHRDVDWFMEIVAPEPELLIPYYKLSIDYYNHAGWTCSKGQFMVSRFAWRDPNWQFSRELARRRFTTRPLPTSNFCTYANLKQICIRISRSKRNQNSSIYWLYSPGKNKMRSYLFSVATISWRYSGDALQISKLKLTTKIANFSNDFELRWL